MTIAMSQVRLTEAGSSIYVLSWGEYDSKQDSGPLLGASDLDFAVLADEYRHDRYAAADAAGEDNCWLDEGDFTAWLLDKGKLRPIETQSVRLEPFSHDFVPTHWPACPECGSGRGEPGFENPRDSLNRVTAYRRCTECRHSWGHVEVANNPRFPMLEDDGRDHEGGCVPFAISKACGLAFFDVLEVCQRHGWSNRHGMATAKAVIAAGELGFALIQQNRSGVGTANAPTLKRLLADLPRDRNYIAGVKGHWLALVRGVIVDNDTNSGPGKKVLELYEVRKAGA